MAVTNVTIQIDEELEKEAEELFFDFGMNMSTAYTVFLRQAIREQRIPFIVSRNIPNAETRAAIEEGRSMLKNPKTLKFNSLDELIKELNDNEVSD